MYLDSTTNCNMLCFQLGNTATGVAATATRQWNIKVIRIKKTNFFPSSRVLLGILLGPSPHGPFFFGGGTLDTSLRPEGGVWGEMGSKL